MKREELAWAAGFMDGEGSIFAFERRAGETACTLRACQAGSPELLERMKNALDGLGYVRGPYAARKWGSIVGKKPMYAYSIYRWDHIQAAIAMLWPWFGSAKRKQARDTLLRMRTYFPKRKYQRGLTRKAA